MRKAIWAIAMSVVAVAGAVTAPPPASATGILPCEDHNCHGNAECEWFDCEACLTDRGTAPKGAKERGACGVSSGRAASTNRTVKPTVPRR